MLAPKTKCVTMYYTLKVSPPHTMHITLKINDGGRAAAGYKGITGDCVCRAIAIASQRPYQEIYDLINATAERERTGTRKRGKSSARNGVYKNTYRQIAESLGGVWTPMMSIGSGCKVHLKASELPKTGRHILVLSKHLAAWVDGELHDIYDCSRDGTRCVYGIFTFPG